MRKAVLNSFAQSLRRNQTEAEKKLWRCLRSRQLLGLKFRRQMPLGFYIADFCSLEGKIVIELDGGHHGKEVEADAQRTKYLEARGYQVVRIWNNEIFANMEGVLEQILRSLNGSPSPRPSPFKGEGGEQKSQL